MTSYRLDFVTYPDRDQFYRFSIIERWDVLGIKYELK